jgi:hypothetical protein
MPKITDEEWEATHKGECRSYLRAMMADAIRPHFDMLGTPGFLTKEDIQHELLAAMRVVEVYQPEKVDTSDIPGQGPDFFERAQQRRMRLQ